MSQTLPQELIDKIFLYTNYSTLEKCRELQSEFVKTTTRYDSITVALLTKNLKNIKWFNHKGRIKFDIITFNMAIVHGDLEIVKWFRKQGCPFNEISFRCAAYTGNLELLIWLKEQGCPWNKEVYIGACKSRNNLNISNWLKCNCYLEGSK